MYGTGSSTGALGALTGGEGRSQMVVEQLDAPMSAPNQDIDLAVLLAGLPTSGSNKPVAARLCNASEGDVFDKQPYFARQGSGLWRVVRWMQMWEPERSR